MSWVLTVSEDHASGTLAEVYQNARQRAGKVPNIAKLQSLRPATTHRGFELYCPADGRPDRTLQAGADPDCDRGLESERLSVLNGVARKRPPVGGRW
jgi:hypothetical protein